MKLEHVSLLFAVILYEVVHIIMGINIFILIITFRKTAVAEFLERNQFLSIIRGHEAQLEGYKMHRWGGVNEFPLVITLFSAANYCDAYKNKGAVIKFSV